MALRGTGTSGAPPQRRPALTPSAGRPDAPARVPASHRRVVAARAQSRHPGQPAIKICGVTAPEDATLAAQAGADFVGMIMWPKARRAVAPAVAARIAEAARQDGAEPVGVFVDEDFAGVVRTCKAAGLRVAQLHGKGARAALPDLPSWLQVVYVLHASPDGRIQTQDLQTPLGERGGRQADWLLIDGLKGGSGQTYDWRRLRPPQLAPGMRGWLLAGGLTPDNVAEALALASPGGVDVSSGVTRPDGLRKDPDKVAAFVAEVRRAALQPQPL